MRAGAESCRWFEALRALREARGVSQGAWAGLLGYSRRTVQRWEGGALVPDDPQVEAIIAQCHARRLFRTYDRGPLAGLTIGEEGLRELLAEARLDRMAAWPRHAGPRLVTRRPLPTPLSSFIGRACELAEVRRLLGDTRLLTLTGAGGIGKTRLALEVARGLPSRYEDGISFVELATLTDPSSVARAIAGAVGVQEEPDRPLVDTLAEALASRRQLLLLDNCEHVLVAVATLVATLLRACPRLAVLTTSREALRVDGEAVYRVPPLSVPGSKFQVPGSDALNSELGTRNLELDQADAVRLFAERATAALPAFRLDDENTGAVARLCRRLDGLPLAIELAAARLPALAVEEIEARLAGRLALLSSGSRSAPPRLQTARAALDWSHDLLTGEERTLFRRLAVFAGGWTLAAVEAVCGEREKGEGQRAQETGDSLPVARCPSPSKDILDLLARLVAKSLVEVEARGAARRYRLLETIRAYAEERLDDSTDADALCRRHAEYFLTLAERHEPARPRLQDPDVWQDELDPERDNLRLALMRFLRGSVAEAEQALRLAVALGPYWMARLHWAEGRDWLTRALERAGETAPASIQAKALFWAGRLAREQDDVDGARPLLEQSLPLWRAAGPSTYLATVLETLSAVELNEDQYAMASAYAAESLAVARELGDAPAIALALSRLGVAAFNGGDRRQGRSLLEQALASYRELGHTPGIAMDLNMLGIADALEGDFQRALACFEESLAYSRLLAPLTGMVAATLANIGDAARQLHDEQRSASAYRESLLLARDLGRLRLLIDGLSGMAELEAARGSIERAARLAGAAEGIRARRGAPVPSYLRAGYQRRIAAVSVHRREPAIAAAWSAGAALSIHDAVAEAVGRAPASPGSSVLDRRSRST